MKQVLFDIGEYLSYHSASEDIRLINDIQTNWIGNCIWLNQGGKQYYNMYTLPTYKILGIDMDKSTLIVQPIKAIEISKESDYEGNKYGTYAFEVEPKKRSLRLKIVDPLRVKVGTCIIFPKDVKPTDLSKPVRVNTWMRLYD